MILQINNLEEYKEVNQKKQTKENIARWKKEFKKSNCISEVFDEEKLNQKLLKCKDKEMKRFL